MRKEKEKSKDRKRKEMLILEETKQDEMRQK